MPKASHYSSCFLADITSRYADYITCPWLLVKTSTQLLHVIENKVDVCQYRISTSKFGNGCEQDSFKTPLGAHLVAQRIGADKCVGEIFVGREPTGKIGKIISEAQESGSDLILTRILWLKGLECNINAGAGVDSYHRYIYIHGTHEEGLLGTAASHGCIRMANTEIIELFGRVSDGTFVFIC